MSFGSSEWQNWVLEEEESFKIIKRAWELGINFFDTADVYSNGKSEIILGNALKQLAVPRQNVVIATKVYFPVASSFGVNMLRPDAPPPDPNGRGLSRKHIFESIEASLQRLQTSYVDLYQIHRWDSTTPIEETMEALNDLVRSGKVRYIGASSMYTWQFAKAQHIAEKRGWARFVSMQNLYNLLYREEEREMIPFCLDQGVGGIPWSPLARGKLGRLDNTSSTTRSNTDINLKRLFSENEIDDLIIDRVRQIVERRNQEPNAKQISAAQVAIAWLLSKPFVASPIIGVTKLDQLENLVAGVTLRLTEEEIKSLEQPYRPKPIVGHM